MSFLIDLAWSALGLAVMFAVLSVIVLSLTWLERKALGRLQLRYGPTRTGKFGLMQPIADAVKLILKGGHHPQRLRKGDFLDCAGHRGGVRFRNLGNHTRRRQRGYQEPAPGPVLHHRLCRHRDSGPGAGRLGFGQQVRHHGWPAVGGAVDFLRNSRGAGGRRRGHPGPVPWICGKSSPPSRPTLTWWCCRWGW